MVTDNSSKLRSYVNFSNKNVCSEAKYQSSSGPVWHSNVNKKLVAKAKSRGLTCGVFDDGSKQVAETKTNTSGLPACPFDESAYWDNCFGTYIFSAESEWAGDKYVGEFKVDKFSGQAMYAFAEAHSSIAYEFYQPKSFIISCLATLLNDSQLIIGNRLPCRCIASVRHERATEGVTTFNAMLTRDKVDHGSYRTDHAL